jgi:hypothetical protein
MTYVFFWASWPILPLQTKLIFYKSLHTQKSEAASSLIRDVKPIQPSNQTVYDKRKNQKRVNKKIL